MAFASDLFSSVTLSVVGSGVLQGDHVNEPHPKTQSLATTPLMMGETVASSLTVKALSMTPKGAVEAMPTIIAPLPFDGAQLPQLTCSPEVPVDTGDGWAKR